MSPARVVIVGAGLGGLAAAIRMRARGHRVTVLEAGDQIGGRARVFRQDGFTFDSGPTVITAPYLFDELFAAAGRDRRDYFELVPVDPFYRVAFPGGEHFDYVGDDERLLAEIERFEPRDVDGYRRLLERAREIFEIGYLRLADVPFSRLSDMLRIIPNLVSLGAYRSVHGLVSSYLRDERLRQVFTFQPLLVGGNPFRTPAIYLLIHWLERKWGVHFAKGGTTAIVSALGKLLEEMGVEVRTGAAVRRIEVDAGAVRGVELESGKRIASECVIANADPSVVYGQLIDADCRRSHSDASIRRVKQSMSLFVGYFGTSRRYEEVAHHTIMLGPRYRGLLEDIFERKELAHDFSLYLHRPTRTDPSLAPAGHDAFYVLSPVPNQASGIDWASEAPRYFDRILQALDKSCLPGVMSSLVTQRSIDPRYFESDLRSHTGAAFGPEPRLTQSAYFRYHNASEDVRGLYFVGAGTHPGAGVPGVLCSAKVLERVFPPAVEGERQLAAPQ